MKKVYVTIGYNDALEFRDAKVAWNFIDEAFHSISEAENPEVASIGVCFKREDEDEHKRVR